MSPEEQRRLHKLLMETLREYPFRFKHQRTKTQERPSQKKYLPQRIGGGSFVGIDKRTGAPIYDIGPVPCHSFKTA